VSSRPISVPLITGSTAVDGTRCGSGAPALDAGSLATRLPHAEKRSEEKAMPLKQLMQKLRHELTTMSELVEKNVNDAIMALIERSNEMAGEVIEYDRQIDEMELTIDNRCTEILRLSSPKTDEFRFVYASIKIATDLERISDRAVDIARQVQFLTTKRSLQTDLSGHFAEMLEFASMMVRDSVISVLENNVELAWRVCAHDEIAQEAYEALEAQLYGIIETDLNKAARAARLLLCARDLARIADHGANIAEDVIYILEGKLVQHHIDEWRKKLAPELDKRRRKKRREL
jgi:phosphate transport system protein